MLLPPLSATRRRTFVGLLTGLSIAAGVATFTLAQEGATSGVSRPKGDSVRTDKDPLRARSATDNVAFGQIISTDDHRLTLREGEGDSATQTVYRLSPTVRVFIRDRQIELKDLPPDSRVRFPRVSGPEAEITELYAVDELPARTSAPATTRDSADEVAPEPARDGGDDESTSSASNDVVPEVKLGATLQTTTAGVEIVRLDAISPLRDAGMKAADLIKTAAGQSVVTPEGLFRVLNDFDGGATVELTAVRDDKELEFSMKLPEDHKKVLVDAAQPAGPVRETSTATSVRGTNARILQQIRRTQEQQQAQLKYLYDGLMQLAQAANVNQGIFGNPAYPFGGVLPVGVGDAGSGNNCFGAIGFDPNGNPVIGFNQAGVAIGVLGFNPSGQPILGETTLQTPDNDLNDDGIADGDTDGDGIPDDYNNDGIKDDQDGDGFPPNPAVGDGQAPQQPREQDPDRSDDGIGTQIPPPSSQIDEPFGGARRPGNPAPQQPAIPRPRRSAP